MHRICDLNSIMAELDRHSNNSFMCDVLGYRFVINHADLIYNGTIKVKS